MEVVNDTVWLYGPGGPDPGIPGSATCEPGEEEAWLEAHKERIARGQQSCYWVSPISSTMP